MKAKPFSREVIAIALALMVSLVYDRLLVFHPTTPYEHHGSNRIW